MAPVRLALSLLAATAAARGGQGAPLPRAGVRGAAPRALEAPPPPGVCDGAPPGEWTYRFPPGAVAPGHRCYSSVIIW